MLTWSQPEPSTRACVKQRAMFLERGKGPNRHLPLLLQSQRLCDCSCACTWPNGGEVFFLLKELNAYFMGTVSSSGPCVLLVLCSYHCIVLITLTIVGSLFSFPYWEQVQCLDYFCISSSKHRSGHTRGIK